MMLCEFKIVLECTSCHGEIIDCEDTFKMEVESGRIIVKVPLCDRCYGGMKAIQKELAETYHRLIEKD